MSCTTCAPVISIPVCTAAIVIGQAITAGTFKAYITNTILGKTIEIELAPVLVDGDITVDLSGIAAFVSPNFIYNISIAEGAGQPVVPFNVDAVEVECLKLEFIQCLDGDLVNLEETSVELHLNQ